PLPDGTLMRRPETADLMLLVTVVIWSLNFTVTKFVLDNGFEPLAYGGVRFAAAAALFAGVTYGRERSVRLRRRDAVYLAGAAYSVAIAPLMRRYTASRLSAWALSIGGGMLLAAGAPQLASQDYGALPNTVWLAYVFAVVGPLFVTNLLWFNAIDRVGPSRAA